MLTKIPVLTASIDVENLCKKDVELVNNLRDKKIKNIVDFIDSNREFFSDKWGLYDVYEKSVSSLSKDKLSEELDWKDLELWELIFDLCDEFWVTLNKISNVINFSIAEVLDKWFKNTFPSLVLNAIWDNKIGNYDDIEFYVSKLYTHKFFMESWQIPDEIKDIFYKK